MKQPKDQGSFKIIPEQEKAARLPGETFDNTGLNMPALNPKCCIENCDSGDIQPRFDVVCAERDVQPA